MILCLNHGLFAGLEDEPCPVCGGITKYIPYWKFATYWETEIKRKLQKLHTEDLREDN